MKPSAPSWLITHATILNEGTSRKGSVLIAGDRIADIFYDDSTEQSTLAPLYDTCPVIQAQGSWLLPGLIDDQVHFREPGLTHKGNLRSESSAAVAGGITSFMDMPNTVPQTTTRELLRQKNELASRSSLANYAFFLGATKDNLAEIRNADPEQVCGVKLFMGSSTGNMLVDSRKALEDIFATVQVPLAIHSEDEATIRQNIEHFRARYGEDVPVSCHPLIRSAEACYRPSALAVELAHKHGTRLHIMHLSTARELSLLERGPDVRKKKITAEACVHHLWFNDGDYARLGNRIKWNPAVKTRQDQEALTEAIRNNTLDLIATDHAPHTLEEKNNSYFKAPSGGPLVQFALQALIDLAAQGKFSPEQVVTKMCHAPADLYGIRNRGYIRKGYYADLVLLDPGKPFTVTPECILSSCGWSPFEGHSFGSTVTHTWVNGNLVVCQGALRETPPGAQLLFDRQTL